MEDKILQVGGIVYVLFVHQTCNQTSANAGDTGCQQTPGTIECGAVAGWQQLFPYSSFSYNSPVVHTY